MTGTSLGWTADPKCLKARHSNRTGSLRRWPAGGTLSLALCSREQTKGHVGQNSHGRRALGGIPGRSQRHMAWQHFSGICPPPRRFTAGDQEAPRSLRQQGVEDRGPHSPSFRPRTAAMLLKGLLRMAGEVPLPCFSSPARPPEHQPLELRS